MANNNEPLFHTPQKRGAVLLIDRSGSTGNLFKDGRSVFSKMCEIVKQLGHEEYRVVFWSSPSYSEGRFVNGVMSLPFVVKQNHLQSAFDTAGLVTGGGTCPYLGFRAMNPEWLENNPMVYFVTDGQIGCGEVPDIINKSTLAEEIRKLPTQLTIIAVENVVRNFNDLDQVNNSAGGDIYQIIQSERLTSKVTKFVSYNPNGHFVQINKVQAPPGYAPYGEKYFSLFRVPEFMEVVKEELKQADETTQLSIAQKLSSTLEVLTRDKPERMATDIIRVFTRLFSIDPDMVQYIITGAIARERGGQAQVFANYRAELKNLFAQADGLLKQDVCSAVGMNDSFVSPVIANRILSGSYRLIDQTTTIYGQRYPRGGYNSNVPVFPLLSENQLLTELQDQCLRQWIRVVYSAMYETNAMSDEIIYLVMGDTLRVCRSNVDERVKTAYRELSKCMLRKKRLNSIQTEMDRLMNGELPVPNSGKFQDFEAFMQTVKRKLDLSGSILKTWYEMCLNIDTNLGRQQKQHCQNDIQHANDFECKIENDNVPDSNVFDYHCIITLQDISEVGGYKIRRHDGIAGSCSPIYLLSQEGKQQMLNSAQCLCPVCYATLRGADFEPIGPKLAFNLLETYNSFAEQFARGPPNKNPVDVKSTGTLVIMKGVVGAGKTTWSMRIKEAVESRGGFCLVEGTDKYCQNGTQIKDAVSRVTQALQRLNEVKNNDIVVVLDTCGNSNPNEKKFFGVDFSKWKRVIVWPSLDRSNLSGYFAWSLRNVLSRKKPSKGDNYYLNPVDAGASICVDVHKKKAKNLFHKDFDRFWKFDGATLNSLKDLADSYKPVEFDFVSLQI